MCIPKCLVYTQVSISGDRSQSPSTSISVLTVESVASKHRFWRWAKKARQQSDVKENPLEKQRFRS
jgi:hypothetical protein